MAYTSDYAAVEPGRDQVAAQPGALVLEFGAPWCGHCLRAQPAIAAALGRYPRVPHIKIEDGPGRPLGRAFRVKLWPTLVFVRNGQEVARRVRPSTSAEVDEALRQIAD